MKGFLRFLLINHFSTKLTKNQKNCHAAFPNGFGIQPVFEENPACKPIDFYVQTHRVQPSNKEIVLTVCSSLI